MNTQRDTASAFEQAFHRTVQDVVAAVGLGQGEITVGATERSPWIMELRPLRKGAARILVQVTPGFYVVEIGEGGRFEFVGKRGASASDDAREVARFVEAAVRGLYSERLWLRRGQVQQVWGRLKVDGQWRESRQYSILPLPWLYTREIRQYESYAREEHPPARHGSDLSPARSE